MRVLITGATGYVGGRITAAVKEAGHEVRLLVRSPNRTATLRPLGLADLPTEVGDITDRESVRRALDGCDAVVHAAAVYSLDRRSTALMERVNAPGTANVLEEAAELGLDPVVHVSSTVAFLPGTGETIGPDSPVGAPRFADARTKADSERIARRLQDGGAAVVSVYPGAVYGANDPYFGEQAQLVRALLRRRLPVLPTGGFHVVDADDVGATVAALLEPGRGPRRYVVPGWHRSVPEIADELSRLTGRRIPYAKMSSRVLMPSARPTDALQRLLPIRLPVSGEAIYVTACDLRFDDSKTRSEFGLEPRPFADTLREMVAWLAAEGRIPRRAAGALADTPDASPTAAKERPKAARR